VSACLVSDDVVGTGWSSSRSSGERLVGEEVGRIAQLTQGHKPKEAHRRLNNTTGGHRRET
jgi:hypothetical protein